MSTTSQLKAKVECREIHESDLSAICDLLTLNFPERKREFWARGCTRLRNHLPPVGLPKFGYLLEHEGAPVGVIFTIFTSVLQSGEMKTRCSTSGWSVMPTFQGKGLLLARQVLKHADITYFNPTPAPDTWRILDHLGFLPYCRGHFLSIPAFNRITRGVVVEKAAPHRFKATKLQAGELELLLDHLTYGCVSLVVSTSEQEYPFVFLRRVSKTGVPYAQLIYSRNGSDFIRFAGSLGRYLAVNGLPAVLIDSNGPISGLVGKFFDARPRYFKGPDKPRLGDLAYTEVPLFGS